MPLLVVSDHAHGADGMLKRTLLNRGVGDTNLLPTLDVAAVKAQLDRRRPKESMASSLRRFSALTPVSFDTDVLTANTEAFKLGEETVKRLTSFGSAAAIPLNLVSRTARAGTSTVVAKNDTPTNGDELETSGPKSKKVVLVPSKPKVEEEVVPDMGEKPPEETKAKGGVAAGVIIGIVAGVAILGTGAAFGIMGATSTGPFRPVTGTVTATW